MQSHFQGMIQHVIVHKNKEREWRQRRRAQCADQVICSVTLEVKCVGRRCTKAVDSSACLSWLSCMITGQREALFTTGVSMHPGWSDHKWTALSAGVNASNASSMLLKTERPHWRTAVSADVCLSEQFPTHSCNCGHDNNIYRHLLMFYFWSWTAH